jgi:hypothetical protein
MRIREVLDKRVGDKSYSKFLVTLPKDVVKESGLIGKELKVRVDKNKICIEKE